MGPGRKVQRAGLWLALLTALVGPLHAQEAPVAILTLDQDRFFLESAFGKASLERERAATAALEKENKRIEAELVSEEQALTNERGTLSAEEFSAKAKAFDAKVEQIRTEQDAKARLLAEAREGERQQFLAIAVPILGELLGERKAQAIVDKSMTILSLSAIDVTDAAIAKVDAAMAKAAPVAP
jgi:Skp family chaperone for outer membrane proteins